MCTNKGAIKYAKGKIMSARFRYKWFAKGDIDAYFGLLFDVFSKIIAAIAIMIYAFGMPTEIVMGRILPGLGLATLFGNLWYAYEAYRLAHKEQRQDVTAQPYGVSAVAVFGWLFLIIGPVYWDTGNAVLAWQVGLAACFLGGMVEIIGAVLGQNIIKWTPRAALLGNLAAVSVVWLSLVSMLEIYANPVVALLPLFIALIAFFGKVKMPFNMPAGFFAILVGTIIAWATGSMSTEILATSVEGFSLYLPSFSGMDLFTGFKYIVPYLPIVIPLQVANFLSTLQGLESAAVAGDKYPVRLSMTMDGVGTIVGSLFGNPFPTTVFYGHPSWKELGAKAGYSIMNGVTFLLLGLTGVAGIISAIIPYSAVLTLLLFVGLVCGAQAFTEGKKNHVPAILFGFLPIIAQYLETSVRETLAAVGTDIATVGVDSFSASFPIQGIISLSQGAFLSGLLLTAIVACVMDYDFIKASLFALLTSLFAFIGLIHAPSMEWASPNGTPFAIIYLSVAIFCWVVDRYKFSLGKPEVDEFYSEGEVLGFDTEETLEEVS
jgi:AGZA family xanthine/uracil permease-like MFS transporter